jgi:hypothetical protein
MVFVLVPDQYAAGSSTGHKGFPSVGDRLKRM